MRDHASVGQRIARTDGAWVQSALTELAVRQPADITAVHEKLVVPGTSMPLAART